MSLSKEIGPIIDDSLLNITANNTNIYDEHSNEDNHHHSINSIKKLMGFFDVSFNNLEELIGLQIERDSLLDPDIVHYYNSQQQSIKSDGYRSSKLTSLHENSNVKQSFPAINMLRQLLKCNGYRLKPYVRSIGYDDVKGGKKIKRYFIIEKNGYGL
jgi:hypothetical protein